MSSGEASFSTFWSRLAPHEPPKAFQTSFLLIFDTFRGHPSLNLQFVHDTFPSVFFGAAVDHPNRLCRLFDGLLLADLRKNASNLLGVCQVIFDDNMKNGEFQKVGTTPPIEKALVN